MMVMWGGFREERLEGPRRAGMGIMSEIVITTSQKMKKIYFVETGNSMSKDTTVRTNTT